MNVFLNLRKNFVDEKIYSTCTRTFFFILFVLFQLQKPLFLAYIIHIFGNIIPRKSVARIWQQWSRSFKAERRYTVGLLRYLVNLFSNFLYCIGHPGGGGDGPGLGLSPLPHQRYS